MNRERKLTPGVTVGCRVLFLNTANPLRTLLTNYVWTKHLNATHPQVFKHFVLLTSWKAEACMIYICRHRLLINVLFYTGCDILIGFLFSFKTEGHRSSVVTRWTQSRGSSDRYCSGASFITKFHLIIPSCPLPKFSLNNSKKWPKTPEFQFF